jgi:lipoprotein signal peptidase
MVDRRDRNAGRAGQWFGWVVLLILIDQTSKALIRTYISQGSRFPLIDGFIDITFDPNYRGFSWFVTELPDWVNIPFLLL